MDLSSLAGKFELTNSDLPSQAFLLRTAALVGVPMSNVPGFAFASKSLSPTRPFLSRQHVRHFNFLARLIHLNAASTDSVSVTVLYKIDWFEPNLLLKFFD
uniref:(northern house mosquito) hypothetical protein n=1 Tax=Culex pipiens TaxID=7175 RepID=A0A8D8IE13_CULPI